MKLITITCYIFAVCTLGLVVWGCAGLDSSLGSGSRLQAVCATDELSPQQVEEAERLTQQRLITRGGKGNGNGGGSSGGGGGGPITVSVHFHVIMDDAGNGDVSDAILNEHINILNGAFAGDQHPDAYDTGFRFELASIDRTQNSAWYTAVRYDDNDAAMTAALRQGTAEDLNVYIRDLEEGLTGWGTFPWSIVNFDYDGVQLDNSEMPGAGGRWGGDLTVHEVGHWLGLFHTFHNGCDKINDMVGDTPAQAHYNWNCPTGTVDTCTGGQFKGNDPTTNFMDYSPESCKWEFTRGQNTRMQDMWAAWRAVQ